MSEPAREPRPLPDVVFDGQLPGDQFCERGWQTRAQVGILEVATASTILLAEGETR